MEIPTARGTTIAVYSHQLLGGWYGKVSTVASPAGREDGLHPVVGARGAHSRPVRDFPASRLHLEVKHDRAREIPPSILNQNRSAENRAK